MRGFTRHPSSGVASEKRGTYAGVIEKIPYLKDLGVTAVELLPVFQFDAQDCPPGKTNYWGYAAGLILRAASGVQLAGEPARSPRRISRHGQGAPPRGPRSHPRCCLQSHNGRRPDRTDVVLSRSGERLLLHPREGQIAIRRLHRVWQHAECQSVDRAPADPGQPALLGIPDARGRLPLRSGLDPVARRGGPFAAEPARSLGHRVGSVAGRYQADC